MKVLQYSGNIALFLYDLIVPFGFLLLKHILQSLECINCVFSARRENAISRVLMQCRPNAIAV